MNTAVAVREQTGIGEWDEREIDVIKNVICPGITDADLNLFAIQCKRTGLDPFSRQIYAIYRGNDRGKRLSIEASIDGFRLVADRTGNYCPGRPTEYAYDANNRITSATAYVKKYVHGAWHEIAVTAFMSEFGQSFGQWNKMPHVMLGKCAEAQALRKAFPNDLSGLYTADEMAQADRDERDQGWGREAASTDSSQPMALAPAQAIGFDPTRFAAAEKVKAHFKVKINPLDGKAIGEDDASDLVAVFTDRTNSDPDSIAIFRYLCDSKDLQVDAMDRAEMTALLDLINADNASALIERLLPAARAWNN